MGRLTGDLKERTLAFGTAVLDVLIEFPNEQRSWIVARQLGRSATSVGANVWEADAALTDSDFAYKISIARKECHETMYWIELARRTMLLRDEKLLPLRCEAEELCRILGTIVRKTQNHVRTQAK